MNIQKVFPDIYVKEPLDFQNIKLTRAATITSLATKHKVPVAILQDLNPDISSLAFRSNAMLPRGYMLKIPATPMIMSNND